MEDLTGHLHRIRTIRLSNGTRLILKISPSTTMCLLRHESHYLETEAGALDMLAKSNLPIPRILKYDRRSLHLGAPFLLTTHVRGVRYSDVLQQLTCTERASIESQLRSLRSVISQHTSPTFGPVGFVKLNGGHKRWKDAFITMLESVLMDGEDVMVNLPYFQIREAVSRWESYLDCVGDARLVVLGLGCPENVFIDRSTCEVTGLLDFGHAVWGDVKMAEMESSGNITGLL